MGLILGLGLLNGVLLLLAIRSCWDRPGSEGLPWFALSLPLRLRHGDGGWSARLQAVSASGAELRLGTEAHAERLESAEGLLLEGLVPDLGLPFVPMVRCQEAIGGCWGPLTPLQRERLEDLLYRREGLWPTLRAPMEARTLPLVLLRLLQRVQPEGWFRRSLIPQLPPREGQPLPGPGPVLASRPWRDSSRVTP